jgi:hypothetical protein
MSIKRAEMYVELIEWSGVEILSVIGPTHPCTDSVR